MEKKEIQLDDEAEELYRAFHGLDKRKRWLLSAQGEDRLSKSLEEEEKRGDALRTLLIRLLHLLGGYFMEVNSNKRKPAEAVYLKQLDKVFLKFSEMENRERTILIRFRGASSEDDAMEGADYEVLFGNIELNLEIAVFMAARLKKQSARMDDQLKAAFHVLRRHGVVSLCIKIPVKPHETKRMWKSLRISARYPSAASAGKPIEIPTRSRRFTLPLIHDERDSPDPNLTLIAGLNGLSPKIMRALVNKVNAWIRKSKASGAANPYSSVYNALLGLKKIRKKLAPPPMEINNEKWLMVDTDEEEVSEGMARVARLAMDAAGVDQGDAAKLLKSVYGKDFDLIDSEKVLERLTLTSGLLDSNLKKSSDENIEKEILGNVDTRLDQVKDDVFDNIVVEGGEISSRGKSRNSLLGKIHDKLVGMVSFYKKRSVAKQKMKKIVHQVVDFDHQDYEALARDFDVSVEDAQELITLLKSCFDEKGHFQKGVFSLIIPEFVRYERRIFEFLWHYMKETLHQQDRTAFLNSLQLLVDRLKRPKAAVKVLLEDLCKNPEIIRFADRKAFMLGTLLIRQYNHELISYAITPEDVLNVWEGVDNDVARYASWRIDKNQEVFFEKVRNMHRRTMESLDVPLEEMGPMDIEYLIAQEREAYIFLAMVGGRTARSILLSALKEYGAGASEIYHLRNSGENMVDLLQLLTVVIRGFGRIGAYDDLYLLDKVRGSLMDFMELARSIRREDLVQKIVKWVQLSQEQIMERA